MFKLIKNELVKIFTKISTYLMLGLILIFIAGIAWLTRMGGVYTSHAYTYDAENIRYEMEFLESSKPQGYELELKKFQYMKDSGRDWVEGHWQMGALTQAFESWQSPLVYQADTLSEEEKARLQQSFDEEMKPVLEGDWTGYATYILEQIQKSSDTESMKEANSFYYRYMLDQNLKPDEDDWRESVALETGGHMKALARMEQQEAEGNYVSRESLDQAKNDLAICRYRLDNGVSAYMDENGNATSPYWSAFKEGAMVITFVSVLMIVIAGGCVANEFSAGTIKFLLINPVKRGKIIVSKYLTLIFLSVVLILGAFLFTGLADLAAHGTGDLGMPLLKAVDGVVSVSSPIGYVLVQYLLNGVDLIVMTTMAFMISSLLRSSAVSIGIGVAALMGGNVVAMLLAQFGCDWGRYLLFANLNLSGILKGNTFFPSQTLTFAVGTILVYMAVFLITAYDAFTRREV